MATGLNWSFNTSHLAVVPPGACPQCESRNIKQDGLFSPEIPGITPFMILSCRHCGFKWVPDQKEFDREASKPAKRIYTEEQKARHAETKRLYEAKRKDERNAIKTIR